MHSKQLLVSLLAISLLPLMASSPSQVSTSLTTIVASSTLTSYSTYTVGMTQVTSTVTRTIHDGNLPLPGWSATGCGFAAFPFNADPGDQLTLNFVSTVPIDFYLMTVFQFSRVPPQSSLCSYGALPIFSAIKQLSYVTSYSLNWTPETSGLYYIVLMDLQAESASALLSATITSLQIKPLVINATTTTTITDVSSQTLSTFVTVQSSTVSSMAMPAQSLQWIIALLIVLALVGWYSLSKRRSVKNS